MMYWDTACFEFGNDLLDYCGVWLHCDYDSQELYVYTRLLVLLMISSLL